MSGGLHCELAYSQKFAISANLMAVRYPASFNEFAVHGDFETYRQKLEQAKATFTTVYNSVKEKVDASMK